jgi:hypothetical protein
MLFQITIDLFSGLALVALALGLYLYIFTDADIQGHEFYSLFIMSCIVELCGTGDLCSVSYEVFRLNGVILQDSYFSLYCGGILIVLGLIIRVIRKDHPRRYIAMCMVFLGTVYVCFGGITGS